MQSAYAESFDRVMTCTVADWLRLLPPAIGDNAFTHTHDSQAGLVAIALRAPRASSPVDGILRVKWEVGAPRRIALVQLPQLHAGFQFENTDAATRLAFMQRFDLFMQRGGG